LSGIDKINTGPIQGARGLPEKLRSSDSKPAGATGAVPFSELLNESLVGKPTLPTAVKSPELKFSAHAQTRMQSRGIELSPDEMLKLKEAVDKAGAKGSRESLILTDKAAFVVSVRNGTVITAVDRESLKENVFTNIDSTVMI